MQFGNVFVKVVTRKLQGSGRSFQYMILSGFDPKLTHATCTHYETLSPNHVLTQQEIVDTVEKLRKANSAQGVKDVTHETVAKKLRKLFDLDGELPSEELPSFAALGIGRYL